LPKTADAGRFLQPVAGGWLAAVTAVQSEPPLQFVDAHLESGHLGPVACLLRQQRSRMALLLRRKQRADIIFRQQAEGGAIHRLLGIGQPNSCQPKSSPGSGATPQHPYQPPAGTGGTAWLRTWAVTLWQQRLYDSPLLVA
jgi:hypothetical protein